MSSARVHLFDSTLRDGAQTHGVDFSTPDKAAIAVALDAMGIDYIEGGWPGANPTDDAFFADPPSLGRARLCAFGMTRRAGRSADNDPGLRALLEAKAPVAVLVGKSWDFQCKVALGVEPGENLHMIADSIAFMSREKAEAMYDAEHFFDGYKANPAYATATVKAALEAGARWAVLCDTNGGTLAHEIGEIITALVADGIPGDRLGIHAHNDTGNAVANSLAAVRAGARQVQGTLNGLGERCGNANLVSLIPSLMLKMDLDVGLSPEHLVKLTETSRALDERLNRAPDRRAPYVGESAFAHKGGLHVSAVEKDPRCYEHIDPALVGNKRQILVSDQAGRSNVLSRLREIGLTVDPDDPKIARVVEEVKLREFKGYAYDGAGASFELLARRLLHRVPEYFRLTSFRVIDERRWNAKGELITLSEATIKADIGGEHHMAVAEGNGPVNALDAALRKVLVPAYPHLAGLRLVDYKVRILTPEAATAAVTRVLIESADRAGNRWTTVGVSPNVIDASFNALHDSITFALLGANVPAAETATAAE
ncbi:citramalate synthase [Rhodospira trueperi]|uniref:Citramalate synthase n=1 Tax=Rhodospira trueperi TaxID=69960 RepID=A0A1G7GMK9_9PROT|nr:citramalate synthase [Rhodospira trueperi]SDE89408.1 2-isopropylmalate synthase [Rhodospira trueperi]